MDDSDAEDGPSSGPPKLRVVGAEDFVSAPDDELMFVPVVTPIVLEVADDLVPFVDARKDGGRFLVELIPSMRDGLFMELGVRLPGVRVRGQPALPSGGYQIQLNEVPAVTGEVKLHHLLVDATPERLDGLGVPAEATQNPATRAPAAWVPEAHRARLEAEKLTTWDTASYLSLHLAEVLRRNARLFLGIQEVGTMLAQLEKVFPLLVRDVVPGMVSRTKLARILRRLVEEQISIRDLRGVLEALAEWAPVERDEVMLTEHVRGSFRRYISHKYARGANTLVVWLLTPRVEDAIRGAIVQKPSGSHLAMEPELAKQIIEAVKRECATIPPDARPPVVLTAMDIRRYVRKLLEYELTPPLSVLSHEELSPDLNVQPTARIGLE